MKATAVLTSVYCLAAATLFSQSNIQQSLSVNSTGSGAHASAQLDVSATDKGMLVPRMTSAQRTAIASPATGLLVFDTATGGFWFYNGTAWVSLATPNVLADADNDTKIQVEESPDEDIIRFDLAGTESLVLQNNASGSPRLELYNPLNNTFLGAAAGNANTTGTDNTATGFFALGSNTIGSDNTATGYLSLLFNTTGYLNTATGYASLFSNSSGYGNAAYGVSALFSNSTGFNNSAFGSNALRSSTSASNNTAFGADALYSNTTGTANTAHGYSALYSNTTGFENTATGYLAMYSTTVGNFNTATGYKALHDNTTGGANTAHGYSALLSNTTGNNNTAFGVSALRLNTTGVENTAVGQGALLNLITGNNNTALGTYADVTSGTITNATVIGRGTTVNASNKVRIGILAITVIEGQVDWTFPSDARFKFNIHDDAVPGLALIEKLRPVTYQFDTRKFDEHLMQFMPDSIRQRRMAGQDYTESTARVQTGFLAQEVEQVCKELNFDFSGLHVPESETDNYGLAYGSFVPLLVKAVQEQQKIIENGNRRFTEVKLRMENLEAENAALKGQLEAEKAANTARFEKITAALVGAGISVEK